MQVIKMTSDEPMDYELYHFNSHDRYLAISYAPANEHAQLHYNYCIDSNVYSVKELVEQIPIWANTHKIDMVTIYTRNSDAINNELIDALKQMTLINPTGLNNHAFYFVKAYVICESYNNLPR